VKRKGSWTRHRRRAQESGPQAEAAVALPPTESTWARRRSGLWWRTVRCTRSQPRLAASPPRPAPPGAGRPALLRGREQADRPGDDPGPRRRDPEEDDPQGPQDESADHRRERGAAGERVDSCGTFGSRVLGQARRKSLKPCMLAMSVPPAKVMIIPSVPRIGALGRMMRPRTTLEATRSPGQEADQAHGVPPGGLADDREQLGQVAGHGWVERTGQGVGQGCGDDEGDSCRAELPGAAGAGSLWSS